MKEFSSEKDSRKSSTFERARWESVVLHSLLSDPSTTLRSKKHREAIRRLPYYAEVLTRAASDNRIAEILCAAKFWGENAVRIRERRLPFDALDLGAFHKRELRYHGYFRRQTKKLLPALRQFEGFLRDAGTNSQGYETCRDLCEKLIGAVEHRASEEPSLSHTHLQDPSKPQPHTWAGAEIFRILKARHQKKELALARCAELLAIVFPGIAVPDADHLKDSIWQAYLRSRRRYGLTKTSL